jgi:peptide/nickel transport system permease protein
MPGIGLALVQAVGQRDYLVVQGISLVVAIAFVIIQFIIDFIFTIVDPRVVRE